MANPCCSFPYCIAVYAYPGVSESSDLGRPQDVPGNIGWAPLPGSSKVVDRTSGKLTPCTPTLCPHSHRELVHSYDVPAANTSSSSNLELNSTMDSTSTVNGNSTDGGVAAFPPLNASMLAQAGVTRTETVERVNRAPFSAQVWYDTLHYALGGMAMIQCLSSICCAKSVAAAAVDAGLMHFQAVVCLPHSCCAHCYPFSESKLARTASSCHVHTADCESTARVPQTACIADSALSGMSHRISNDYCVCAGIYNVFQVLQRCSAHN